MDAAAAGSCGLVGTCDSLLPAAAAGAGAGALLVTAAQLLCLLLPLLLPAG